MTKRNKNFERDVPNLHWLVPRDSRSNLWLLHADSSTGRQIRSRYADLRCPRCRKVDEDAALARGLEDNLLARTSLDFGRTLDGFVFVSDRFRTVILTHSAGCRFTEIPGKKFYWLLQPETQLSIDHARSGVEFRNRCGVCSRFKETVGLPMRESLTAELQGPVFASPDIQFENVIGRLAWFIATPDITESLTHAGLKGFEIMKMS